jgi:Flp pilus assembly pilin Flp
MAIKPKVKPTKTAPQNSTHPCGKETIMDLLVRFVCDEAGASAVEYALIMTFIAVAIAASVATFGNAIRDSFVASTAKMFAGGSP